MNKNMNISLKQMLGLLGVLILGMSPAISGEDKPNILFIFADDMCYEALGAAGEHCPGDGGCGGLVDLSDFLLLLADRGACP